MIEREILYQPISLWLGLHLCAESAEEQFECYVANMLQKFLKNSIFLVTLPSLFQLYY
jgi:hypothetical protein